MKIMLGVIAILLGFIAFGQFQGYHHKQQFQQRMEASQRTARINKCAERSEYNTCVAIVDSQIFREKNL